MNITGRNKFGLPMLLLLSCLCLSGCSSETPSEHLLKRQIENLLIKETTGKLFEVTFVKIKNAQFTEKGDYLVDAQYTFKYLMSVEDYMTYMFDNTGIGNRIDGNDVKKEVKAALIKKYGRPQVGSTRSLSNTFTFRKEAFGWQIQEHRDYEKIKPFLP